MFKPANQINKLSCLLLPFLGSFYISASAAQQFAQGSVCTSRQVELFSCLLEVGPIITLCLDKETLEVHFMRSAAGEFKDASRISDLQESIRLNPHGSAAVVEGHIPDGIIRLFFDSDYYDMIKPAISIIYTNNTETSFCAGSQYRVPTNNFIIKGVSRSLNIFDLLDYGIARPLDQEREWPAQEDSIDSSRLRHHSARKSPSSEQDKPADK